MREYRGDILMRSTWIPAAQGCCGRTGEQGELNQQTADGHTVYAHQTRSAPDTESRFGLLTAALIVGTFVDQSASRYQTILC